MITDEERREAAELGIRAWLNSYLHEETPHGDIRMAVIAAGFGCESEALSYLQRVLLGDTRPPIDRDALLVLADEMSDASIGIGACDDFKAALWAQRIREALGEPAS